jgi:hypothetical protein
MFDGFERLMFVAFGLLVRLPAIRGRGNGRSRKLTAESPKLETRSLELENRN